MKINTYESLFQCLATQKLKAILIPFEPLLALLCCSPFAASNYSSYLVDSFIHTKLSLGGFSVINTPSGQLMRAS